MNKIYKIILTSIILTTLFYFIPNKSNFNKYYMIPLITSLIIKYSLGDLDIGYTFTYKDILYFIGIISVSMITIYLLTKFTSYIH